MSVVLVRFLLVAVLLVSAPLAQARPRSPAAEIADLDGPEREVFLLGLTRQEARALAWDWSFWARPDQLAPSGEWAVWVALAGRGYGKTRMGAEWVRSCVCGRTPLSGGSAGRVALVAETAADARDVMVQGPSGILATSPPDFRPTYVKSARSLTWPNGAVALTFSASDPEQLRGPEHDLAWSDELAKWRYAQETWDMLQFGLRAGSSPRQLVTTTPRPIRILRDLLAREDVVATRGSTYDNADNLAPVFLKTLRDRYEGTRLGRQEIGAEILDDVPGGLWTRRMLDRRTSDLPLAAGMGPADRVPELRRVVVGVDPSGTSGEEDDSANEVGIVVAGLGVDDLIYVLDDCTVSLGPAGWGRQVVRAYETWRADLVVGERNYGGAMVEHTIRTVRRSISYRDVVATRGKVVRAQPIAALYEQGRVRHLGTLAALEDQMCAMATSGYSGRGSPDRLDALVWAITELAFGRDDRGGTVAVGGHS